MRPFGRAATRSLAMTAVITRALRASTALILFLAPAPFLPGQNGPSQDPRAAGSRSDSAFGFVDMEKVIKSHPRAKSATLEIENWYKAGREQLRTRVEQLRSQRESLDLLTEGSPEWLAKREYFKKEEAS